MHSRRRPLSISTTPLCLSLDRSGCPPRISLPSFRELPPVSPRPRPKPHRLAHTLQSNRPGADDDTDDDVQRGPRPSAIGSPIVQRTQGCLGRSHSTLSAPTPGSQSCTLLADRLAT